MQTEKPSWERARAAGDFAGWLTIALGLAAAALAAVGDPRASMAIGAASCGFAGLWMWILKRERGLVEGHLVSLSEEAEGLAQEREEFRILSEESTHELERQMRLKQVVSSELQKEKEIIQGYLEMANMMMAAVGKDGTVEMVNRKGLALLGVDERDILGESFVETVVAADWKALVKDEVSGVFSGSRELSAQMEYAVKSPQGERRVLWANALLRDADGEPQAVLLCGEDVTDRREQESRLTLMRKMLESIDEGAVAVEWANMNIVWANPASERITGFPQGVLIGKTLGILYPTPAGQGQLKSAVSELADKGVWKGEIQSRQSSGLAFPQRLSLTQIVSGDGTPTHAVAVFSDVTVEKAREEHIHYLASHDTLTGLPNRASFTTALDQALVKAKAEGLRVAILFIDLDHFKKVNDTLGHLAGDKLLIEVAERLKSSLRREDFISRLGGDEFTVILENIGTPREAESAARNVLSALSARYDSIGTHEIRVTPSIGICVYPDDGEDAQSLLKKSDQAMYQAKNDGRGALRFFSPEINAKDIEHLMLENRLRRALDTGEIELKYQPKVDLKTGKISGFEALARWFDKERGQIAPSEFIPIAEETGLIVELGLWALRECCVQLALWEMEGVGNVSIAVNLSARHFRERTLKEDLAKILAETGASPSLLQIELTETAVTADVNAAARIIDSLKQLGVTMAIDDFGTGHSSLARLKSLPVDVLKIDKSFVDGVPEADDSAICNAVIGLGRSMNLKVVAEGVETSEQAKFLRDNGADEAQGWLYEKAVTADEAKALLAKGFRFDVLTGKRAFGGRD